jgi:serine/threonine-protein kinase
MYGAASGTLSSTVIGRPPSRDCTLSNGSRKSWAYGDTISGKYRLESILAEGGMGRIWHARDEMRGQSVVIKVADERKRQPDEVSRLLLEGKAAASLRHPAIVEVFDFGITDRREPFVVMELLEGEDLRTRIRNEGGSMSPIDAVRTLLPILDALGHAHSRGVVHLDVKPDNIFLSQSPDGSIAPKLIDFGLAKADWEPPRAPRALWAGTPAYMSPAQCRSGHAVDSRSDLWAFSVVLYEAIAGKTPWEGLNWPELLQAIVSAPAPSLLCRQRIDESLWRILQRGLAKRPEARWQTSREFAAALTNWLSRRPIAEDPAGSFAPEVRRLRGIRAAIPPREFPET